ncbi:MAG: Ig-like domain repeat protein [Candidatus Competibacteraceae bacterium]|nr:Ig-like domain repeat protein [Candidatus Competibacteraceae bacterium]
MSKPKEKTGSPDDIPQIKHPEVAQLASLPSPQDGMISISIGGNDALFADIIRFCLFLPHCGDQPFIYLGPSNDLKVSSLKTVIYSIIHNLPTRLKGVYLSIKQTTGNKPTFVLGYPNVFPASLSACLAAQTPNSNLSGFNEIDELQFFRAAGRSLNDAIECAALSAGVHYITDDVVSAFDGHEICSSVGISWINSFIYNDWRNTLLLADVPPTQESFHPNIFGQKAYATVLKNYILSKGAGRLPENPAPKTTSELPGKCQNFASNQVKRTKMAATSSLTFSYLAVDHNPPLNCGNQGAYIPGEQVRIKGSGFQPNSTIYLIFRADFGSFSSDLGTATADDQGMLDYIVTVPAEAPPTGFAMLQAGGFGADGSAHPAYTIIALVPSSTDACNYDSENTASIAGRIWSDSNGDGVQSPDEAGLEGITAFLDLDGNGTLDKGEPFATTNTDGYYTIAGLTQGGTFKLSVNISTLPAAKLTFDPDGVTSPNTAQVTLSLGQAINGNDFGYQKSTSTQTTTTITADTPDPSTVGQVVTINYSVTATSGTPTGNVTVSDGAGTTCVGTVAAGGCSLTFTSVGTKTLTATYAGDANFAHSTSVPVTHTVMGGGDNPNTTFTGPSATGSGQVTARITGEAGCSFNQAQFTSASSIPVPPPSGYIFPHGLFSFTVTGCSSGALTLQITYPQTLAADAQYWKYGKTPDNHTRHWYELPATISGNQATFTLTDGGLGDDDLTANGAIVDDGGPSVLATAVGTPIPTLSEWALLLLGLSLMAMVWQTSKGRTRLPPRTSF